MTNNTKTNFLLSLIRSVSVLSLSAGIYIFSLFYLEIINSFQRSEYLIWINCSANARLKVFNDSLNETWDTAVLTNKLDEYIKKTCGNKPKKWKFYFFS